MSDAEHIGQVPVLEDPHHQTHRGPDRKQEAGGGLDRDPDRPKDDHQQEQRQADDRGDVLGHDPGRRGGDPVNRPSPAAILLVPLVIALVLTLWPARGRRRVPAAA
jgi:hypothetical protein